MFSNGGNLIFPTVVIHIQYHNNAVFSGNSLLPVHIIRNFQIFSFFNTQRFSESSSDHLINLIRTPALPFVTKPHNYALNPTTLHNL